jgi:hypothetical protein
MLRMTILVPDVSGEATFTLPVNSIDNTRKESNSPSTALSSLAQTTIR